MSGTRNLLASFRKSPRSLGLDSSLRDSRLSARCCRKAATGRASYQHSHAGRAGDYEAGRQGEATAGAADEPSVAREGPAAGARRAVVKRATWCEPPRYSRSRAKAAMRYLVVDDHTLVREAMQSVILSVDREATVLLAPDGAEARKCLAGGPGIDLVLLDLRLPDADGFALLGEFRHAYPTTAVVVLSGERDEATVRQALDAGAAGFIPKTEPRGVLASALSLVLAGGVYVPREALGDPHFDQPSSFGQVSPESLGVTGRQLDVLALLMKGRTNKHIGRELNLAEPTVKNHVTAILRALKVSSRTEAVVAVTKLGWKLDRP